VIAPYELCKETNFSTRRVDRCMLRARPADGRSEVPQI
jgi:hypothetical protein